MSVRRQRNAPAPPLSDDERNGLAVAVQSVFRKLDKLYVLIVPLFQKFGFMPPSFPGASPARTSRPASQ